MDKTNSPKLSSPQERLELILLGLARGQPVDLLCQQAGVSRELFYRWMKRVRQGALQALEAQKPGPKRVKTTEQATRRLTQIEQRMKRLERKAAALRQERDHLVLVNREALGVIRRRAWDEPPRLAKKNAMRMSGYASSTGRNGSKPSPAAPQSSRSVRPGESTAPRTGGGSKGQSGPKASDEGGSKKP
jgi:transposase-like protein